MGSEEFLLRGWGKDGALRVEGGGFVLVREAESGLDLEFVFYGFGFMGVSIECPFNEGHAVLQVDKDERGRSGTIGWARDEDG